MARATRSAPLFGLFKSPPFHDPKLGELVRLRGLWRGLLTIEAGVSAPLTLSGTRTEPHAQALAAAREVAQAFASWRLAIEQALFEHYEPYAEVVTAGDLPSPKEALPRIAAPGDVWLMRRWCLYPSRHCAAYSLLNLDTPPLGRTSTRLEFGFSQESSSSPVAAFFLREDDARPTSAHRRCGRARSPSGFLARDIFTVLSTYRKKGRPWTSSAPAPPRRPLEADSCAECVRVQARYRKRSRREQRRTGCRCDARDAILE
jgi:hypothetical protein